MSANDIPPVVARIANRIASLTGIGLVHTHDIYAHDDLQPLVVSSISGTPTMRAWWITGPSMSAERITQSAGPPQHRWWTYTVHGIEGLTDDGDSIDILRANALAVTDALDLDLTLNNTCHRTWPCEWPQKPEHRLLASVGAVAYLEIAKRVLTFSTP